MGLLEVQSVNFEAFPKNAFSSAFVGLAIF